MDRNNCEFKFSGEPRGSVRSRVSVRRTALVASTNGGFDNFSVSRRFRARAFLQTSSPVSKCMGHPRSSKNWKLRSRIFKSSVVYARNDAVALTSVC